MNSRISELCFFVLVFLSFNSLFLIEALENKFGIGVYNDTPNSLPLTAQLPLAKALVGERGFVVLFFPGFSKSRTSPEPWWIDALNTAYHLNLRPIIRIGSDNIRDESDDSSHLNYASVAKAYKATISQLPKAPDGSPMMLIIINEPNICQEWTCTDGQGKWITQNQIAIEVAHYIKDVMNELQTLPNVKVSPAPIASVGFSQCECCPGCKSSPQNVIGLDFLKLMLETIPDLYDKADFFSSHPYPCSQLVDGKGCLQWNAPFDQALVGLNYWTQELQVIKKKLPVYITETGWSGHDEVNKAIWTKQAFQEIYLKNDDLYGTCPYLLQGDFLDSMGFPWIQNHTLLQTYKTIRHLRCSLGIPPHC